METKITTDLTAVSDEDLVAEIKRRREEEYFCGEIIESFIQQIETMQIERFKYDGQMLIDMTELDGLLDCFWSSPDCAPILVRQWLQRTTGRP